MTKLPNNPLGKITLNIITFLGLVASILTIYSILSGNNKLELDFEVLTDSDVYDMNASIPKLEIYYDSISLLKRNDNLRIVEIKIQNVGNDDILEQYYSTKSPLGIKVLNAILVENPRIIEASNNYIKKNINPEIVDSNKVAFSKIILEKGDYFVVQLLFLYNADSKFDLVPIGKIAGANGISNINYKEWGNESHFWKQVFTGNIYVQLIKAIVYFSGLLIFLFLSVQLTNTIIDITEKRKRKKIVNQFKSQQDYHYQNSHEIIFNEFVNKPFFETIKVPFVLSDKQALENDFKRWGEIDKAKNAIIDSGQPYYGLWDLKLPNGENISRLDERKYFLINQLINEGFLSYNSNSFVINIELLDTLKAFIRFLQKNYPEFYNRIVLTFEKMTGIIIDDRNGLNF